MKKRILAILLAIALLSSVAAVVAYAADTYAGSADGKTCPKCGFVIGSQTATSEISQADATAKAKELVDAAYAEHFNNCTKVKCETCGAVLADDAALLAHIEKVHPSVDYVCYDCKPEKHFETAEALANHYDQYHKQNTNALQCPYCNFIAPNISAYNDHLAANHQKDGEQVTPRDNVQRFFDKYVMGIGLNVDTNSFSSVVRVFAYITEVLMSVFTDSGASEVFQFAGDSGVTYFFETIVPHFWSIFTGA